jgi:hypothetical protein
MFGRTISRPFCFFVGCREVGLFLDRARDISWIWVITLPILPIASGALFEPA